MYAVQFKILLKERTSFLIFMSQFLLFNCSTPHHHSKTQQTSSVQSYAFDRSPDQTCFEFKGDTCIQTIPDNPPDNKCHVYRGKECLSPQFDFPPDSRCSRYEGSSCVSPIHDKTPDATCSLYQGDTCVAPIIPVSP